MKLVSNTYASDVTVVKIAKTVKREN